MVAKEVIDLLASKVRGMLRIFHIPDIKDGEMRELIYRLGQTSSYREIAITRPTYSSSCMTR